ncbi:MAG: hypothetical protein ACO23C_03085 [Prochlorococcaceae cyanobacterium]
MAPSKLRAVALHQQLLKSLLLGRRGEAGYSMPMVMVIALILVVGGIALANRANQGLLGSIFQNQSWEAREAAEIGMNRLISELNKERNRWLMVKRDGDSEQLWSSPAAGGTVATLRTNPCEPQTTADYSKLDPNNAATSTYGTWYIADDGSVSSSASGATRSYKLVGVTRQSLSSADQLSPFRDRTATPSGVGAITLQVQGQSLRNDGTANATVTLEKTFELVPKCCKSSFGGEHGGLSYALDADNESLCTRNLLGLGLLAGAAQNNTGSVTLRGRATDIEDTAGDPIDPIYCIADNQAGCAISVNAADTDVAVVDAELPPPKTYPNSPVPTPGALDTNNISDTQTSRFLYKVGRGGSAYYVINGSFSSSTNFPSYCSSSATEVHCNLASFSYRNNTTLFVTGTRKIRFYFPNAGTVISSVGNGTLLHCLTISSTDSCASEPTGAQITNLSLFGCESCGTQSLTLRGTTGTLKLFAYFPQGDVELYGNSAFEGLLWTNAVSSTGNPTWTVPGSGVGSVFEYMDMLPTSDGGSASNSLIAYDFIARATNRYRWL